MHWCHSAIFHLFQSKFVLFNVIFRKSALLDCSGVLLFKSVKTTLFSVLWKILCEHVLYPDCSGKFRRENICRLHLQKKAQNDESRTKWRDYISHQDYLVTKFQCQASGVSTHEFP